MEEVCTIYRPLKSHALYHETYVITSHFTLTRLQTLPELFSPIYLAHHVRTHKCGHAPQVWTRLSQWKPNSLIPSTVLGTRPSMQKICLSKTGNGLDKCLIDSCSLEQIWQCSKRARIGQTSMLMNWLVLTKCPTFFCCGLTPVRLANLERSAFVNYLITLPNDELPHYETWAVGGKPFTNHTQTKTWMVFKNLNVRVKTWTIFLI